MNNHALAENRDLAKLSEPESAQKFAATLKAAGDALRMQILAVLATDSFGVLELCQIFDIKQSGMSHHLKVLARAEFVSTRREGNTIFYHRSTSKVSDGLEPLIAAIFESAAKIELEPGIKTNLNAVYQQRANASRDFFLNNADAFKSQQELIASFEVYGADVAKLIDQSKLDRHSRVLEVGPGLGDFLAHLSSRFNEVCALDNSEQMLKQARAYCAQRGLDNVEFIFGDTSLCHAWNEKFDCAVINMVLHHTPSPNQIFKDVAVCMRPGASLFICDLGAHNQDWVRDACGDQWLGFNTTELKQWARNAQLEISESRFLSLRNGFQIQIHQFIKSK